MGVTHKGYRFHIINNDKGTTIFERRNYTLTYKIDGEWGDLEYL
jgi:hypothetical protein